MTTATVVRPSKLPAPTRVGPWKVLSIIAERLPARQLIWLALFVCLLVLGLAAIAGAGISRVATSKPATALAELVKQQLARKADNAP